MACSSPDGGRITHTKTSMARPRARTTPATKRSGSVRRPGNFEEAVVCIIDLVLRLEFVAHAPHRLDEARVGWVGLDLLA